MKHRTIPSVLLASAAVVALVAAGSAGASAAPAPAAPQARVWLTTVDRANQLTEQAPVAFGPGHSAAPTIVVDPEYPLQTMEGFGASITDSSAAVLSALPAAKRDATMTSLFDPEQGIGVSFLRQPIGSSDFTAAPQHYTYDDVPAGQKDFALSAFSIAHDEAQILPLLRQAKQLNPELRIVATPWSPPAWMKTGDSLVGGRLIDQQQYYDAYAAYLVKFVQAYAAAGVPIDYLTVQNEPQNRTPDAYPGTDMPVAQEAKVISALGPLLATASPNTKILGYDHNWSTHEADIANTPPGEDPETDYPAELLDTPAARWIDGTAFHCYSGDPSAQTALHDRYPDKKIFFTECSGSHGVDDPPAQVFRDTLTWHARMITIGVTRNWSKTTMNWNIALDEHNGPHNGGCGTCSGLVTVHDDGTVTNDAEYFSIGHLSKFVRPGAVRIPSTSFGTTGWNGQVADVAFRNPDGSRVLVAHNENDDPRTVAVSEGALQFEYTLPGGSLATFTWPASDALVDEYHPVDLVTAKATATVGGGDASAAIDADASTRWTPGGPQAPGQGVTIDLGSTQVFSRVAIDAGGYEGDFPRGWRLESSADGKTWRTLGTGTGAGQLIDVDVPLMRARYVRITATTASSSWWSLADVRLYSSDGIIQPDPDPAGPDGPDPVTPQPGGNGGGVVPAGEADGPVAAVTGELAATGTDTAAPLGLTGMLLALGALAVGLRRGIRRRRA